MSVNFDLKQTPKERQEVSLHLRMARTLKSAQAAIAVLCGYENSALDPFTFQAPISFKQFAAKIVDANLEEDLYRFLTAMGKINDTNVKFFPREAIRPLIYVLAGLHTELSQESYDDDEPVGEEDHMDGVRDVLWRLTLEDLNELSLYLAEHDFEHLGVSMRYSLWGPPVPGLDFCEEQFVSALRHAIDIIISAAAFVPTDTGDAIATASPTVTDRMSQRPGFVKWFQKLKSDSAGWYSTDRFIVDIRSRVNDMDNESPVKKWKTAQAKRLKKRNVTTEGEQEK